MKLTETFYARPAVHVAVDIIGKVLVRRIGRTRMAGVIVETEAYVGPHDLACHASKGKTSRTSVMFGPPGRAYVYMIYGIHYCFNVVTDRIGYPSAVLIRAIEPLDGIQGMKRRRPNTIRDVDIGSGPGKLCKAMSINADLNGIHLDGETLWIEDNHLDPGPILKGRRIGVDYAGEYRDKQLRFFVADNPNVSRHRFNSVDCSLVGEFGSP